MAAFLDQYFKGGGKSSKQGARRSSKSGLPGKRRRTSSSDSVKAKEVNPYMNSRRPPRVPAATFSWFHMDPPGTRSDLRPCGRMLSLTSRTAPPPAHRTRPKKRTLY